MKDVQEKPSALKAEHPALQNIFNFLIRIRIRIRIRPTKINEDSCRSGAETLRGPNNVPYSFVFFSIFLAFLSRNLQGSILWEGDFHAKVDVKHLHEGLQPARRPTTT